MQHGMTQLGILFPKGADDHQMSTPAEKSILFLFIFLDTDPHLASVVCDLYLFSVSRYELCVCGNLCTCVCVSTNLESPPTMGNFKV
jgi:hypothetical protein